MKKIIFTTLMILLLMLTFVGCKSDTSNGENTIRNFITAYYSVNQSNFDFYKKAAITGAKDSEITDFEKIYEANNKKFKPYLSDKSYNAFLVNRLVVGRIANAYKNNVFIKIKSLNINKINEDKNEKTISYSYQLQLIETNKDTKKQKIVKKIGELTVIKQNGTWKIIDEISL